MFYDQLYAHSLLAKMGRMKMVGTWWPEFDFIYLILNHDLNNCNIL